MKRSLDRIVMAEGLRSGVLISLCAVALGVLGLTPALSWIPEAPLLGAAIVVPVAILVWTGFRSATRSGRLVAGPYTGVLAGAIGGCVGGIAYLIAGKPALNIAIGLLGGALAGAALGFAGALFGWRRTA